MSEDDRYDRPVQAMFTGAARELLRYEAKRRGLGVSTLLRVIATQWLAENVTDADLTTAAREIAAKAGPVPAVVQGTGIALADMAAFVNARCVLDPEARIPVRALYRAWCDWRAERQAAPSSVQAFSTGLRALVSSVRVYRPRVEGELLARHFRGVRLADAA